jgi:hypothetical protein
VKKGVAVDTVILIILGVLVIGLIGYLLYMKFGQVGTSATLNDCRTKVITQYCPQAIAGKWFYIDYQPGNSFREQIPECASFAKELKVDTCPNAAVTCGVSSDLCNQYSVQPSS